MPKANTFMWPFTNAITLSTVNCKTENLHTIRSNQLSSVIFPPASNRCVAPVCTNLLCSSTFEAQYLGMGRRHYWDAGCISQWVMNAWEAVGGFLAPRHHPRFCPCLSHFLVFVLCPQFSEKFQKKGGGHFRWKPKIIANFPLYWGYICTKTRRLFRKFIRFCSFRLP